MTDFIQAFGLLIIIIVCIAFITKLLKQPIIIGYVIAGLLFAYFFSADEAISSQINLLSLIGITLLLFLMGFEFDFRMFRSVGKDIVTLTLIQSAAMFILGIALTLFFPFTLMERIYLALAFSLSSTLISTKMIEDKKETSALYGKLTLGILVFQDVVAIAAMTFITVSNHNWVLSILSLLHIPSDAAIVQHLVSPLCGLVLLFAFAFVMSRYLLNFALRIAASLSELLMIASISVCFIFAEVAIRLGYSDGIGAFIGGVVIANTIYKADIAAKLKPLVTFFSMLFFVGLGFQITFDFSMTVLMMALLYIVASFALKPVLIYVSMRMMKYDLKTSFLTSLNLTPLSEFCIILISGGVAASQIDESLSSIIIIATLVTMLISTYILKYDKQLWAMSQPFLSRCDHFITKDRAETKIETIDADVVFFGYYESGKEMLETLRGKNKKIVVITNDPDHVDQLDEQKIPYYFGSPVTPEFFETIIFSDVHLIISSLSDVGDNKFLLKHLKHDYPSAVMIVTAHDVKQALHLYESGADYVIYPTYVNEKQISVLLDEYTSDISKVIQKKMTDVSKFQELLDDKDRMRKRNKSRLSSNFFQDIDHIVNKLGEFQKVNERTLFHLFKHADPKPAKEASHRVADKVDRVANKVANKTSQIFNRQKK